MKKWVLKALVQKTISFLPGKHRINYLFQQYVTKGVRLSEAYFTDRMIHFKQHLGFSRKYQQTALTELRVLELGTGWYPVIPLGLFLSGVQSIYTVDISKLMDKKNLLATIAYFLEWEQSGRLEAYFTPDPERLRTLEELNRKGPQLSFEELLQQLHLEYLVEDARQLSLAPQSLDLIISNNTFEHIYPDILEAILREFHRVLKADGLMSHFIDMSDHFAHLDKSITIYNYLRFTEPQWNRIDNSIQPQNRWRISHYRALFQKLGLPITAELNRPGDREALRGIPLAEPFRQLTEEDLAISHSYVVTKLAQ